MQQQQGVPPIAQQQQRHTWESVTGGGSTGQTVWSAGGLHDWQAGPLLAQNPFPGSAGQTPPWFTAAGGASCPPGLPVINQFCAGQHSACAPPAAISCPQPQQQAGHGVVTDPLTRPTSASGLGQWVQPTPQPHNVLPPLNLQQHTAAHSSQDAGWLLEQQRFGLNQQQRQRPATPGFMNAASPGPSHAWAACTVATPRPRSTASKVRPPAYCFVCE